MKEEGGTQRACQVRRGRTLRRQKELVCNPLIGVLLLLASTPIGRTEVSESTIGANNISPVDIVATAPTVPQRQDLCLLCLRPS